MGIKREDLLLNKDEERIETNGKTNVTDIHSKETVTLNISKNTLENLFPSYDEKTKSPMQQTADCYLVNSLNAFMQRPELRTEVYKCFTETDTGIDVKYPGSNIKLHLNKGADGKILYKQPKNGLDGCIGHQILEELACLNRIHMLNPDDTNIDKIMLTIYDNDGKFISFEDRAIHLQTYLKQNQTGKNLNKITTSSKIYDCQLTIEKFLELTKENFFREVISSGLPNTVPQLMNFSLESTSDLSESDFSIMTSEKCNDIITLDGRLLNQHAQQISKLDKYGVEIIEPNSSDRKSFVKYDEISMATKDQTTNPPEGENKVANFQQELQSNFKSFKFHPKT